MKPAKFTTLAIVALVALRLGCGWLFFREGSEKLDSGTFTSEHFLRDAKGPLAGMYRGMIPDIYGKVRLNLNETRQHFDLYRNRAAGHFDFDEHQEKQALKAYDRAIAQLKWIFAETAEDREKYYHEAERLYKAKDMSTAAVGYRSDWIESKEAELDQQLSDWLENIDDVWDQYEADINNIATTGLLQVGDEEMTQLEYYGPIALARPGARGIPATFTDRIIPWFTFIVGVLLVLGLFTRVAAVGGSVFLFSVISTQPPWVPGAADINYQLVLMLGLLVCAAVGAGRWGGLDFFLGALWRNCCRGTRSASSEAPPTKQ